MTRTYTICVCPECADGPLVFDPAGIDAAEGMEPRAVCSRGHVVLSGAARALQVVSVREMPCFCGTANASRCPRHVDPVAA